MFWGPLDFRCVYLGRALNQVYPLLLSIGGGLIASVRVRSLAVRITAERYIGRIETPSDAIETGLTFGFGSALYHIVFLLAACDLSRNILHSAFAEYKVHSATPLI